MWMPSCATVASGGLHPGTYPRQDTSTQRPRRPEPNSHLGLQRRVFATAIPLLILASASHIDRRRSRRGIAHPLEAVLFVPRFVALGAAAGGARSSDGGRAGRWASPGDSLDFVAIESVW